MWATLALDYLPTMTHTSVSSKCAFSSAGITISKQRNCLGVDVVEALQFLKCWFQRELIFCDDPSVAAEYECKREHESQSTDGEKTGWNSHILGDEEDICGDDPEPDGDDDDDVFLFECL